MTETNTATTSARAKYKTRVPTPTNVLDGWARDEDFAAELRCHPKTFRHYMDRAGIPARMIGRKRYRRIAIVKTLIETGEVPEAGEGRRRRRG